LGQAADQHHRRDVAALLDTAKNDRGSPVMTGCLHRAEMFLGDRARSDRDLAFDHVKRPASE
jgi:hypothetical protein